MEIRQLRYFIRIAELGSFSRAAQELHVAQPALSYQIAQLEAELHYPLLHRRHNGVQVTEHGQTFLDHAQRIVKQIDELPNVAYQSANQLRGKVAIGLPQSSAARYAVPLVAATKKRYPGIRLELFDEIGANLLRGLVNGRLDLAILVIDHDAALVESIPVLHEEFFFVAGAGHTVGEHCPMERLAQVPLALPGVSVHALVEEAARACGVTLPPLAVVVNSASVLRILVEAGEVFSVVPWATVSDRVEAGAIRAVPLQPRLTRRVYLCCSKRAHLRVAGQAVHDLLLDIIREEGRSGRWPGIELIEA